MHLTKYHWNFELFPFLLPVKPPLKELCVRVLRLDSMLKFTLRQKHNTQTAVIIAKTSKENNGTYCFFTENKKGNACKRSYSGGRLLKSFLRHVRILQKPMQEKERKIDPSSCKSYIYGQKKKSSNWTNDTACSQEAIWLSTVISLEIYREIMVWPLVGVSRQIKVLFISRLIIKLWRNTFELAGVFFSLGRTFDWSERTQKSQGWQECCRVWKLIKE